jgi:hypothetical protein
LKSSGAICPFAARIKEGQSFVTDLEEILLRLDRERRQAIRKAPPISLQTAFEYAQKRTQLSIYLH